MLACAEGSGAGGGGGGGGSESSGGSSSAGEEEKKARTRAVPHVLLSEEELAGLDDEVERVITHRWGRG